MSSALPLLSKVTLSKAATPLVLNVPLTGLSPFFSRMMNLNALSDPPAMPATRLLIFRSAKVFLVLVKTCSLTSYPLISSS